MTAVAAPADEAAFHVHLPQYSGPFDLLLRLIARRRLDVTELALHLVTDEYLAHVRARGDAWDLDSASEFLLVAATLLDLKAARLLPSGAVEDEEDLALLEARDLLFARLLQHRAYQEAGALLADRLSAQQGWHPRDVALEERYARALPQLVLDVTPLRLAELAAAALVPRPAPEVPVEHLHAPVVSVREQSALLVERLRRAGGSLSFAALSADAPSVGHVVARFLALLELFRDRRVAFEQPEPLGELHVRWTAERG